MITIIGEIGRPATKEEIDHFLNTKKWSEMTEQEVNSHKRKQCVKCQYLSRQNGKSVISAVPCDYLIVNGHSRGCSPLDCKIFGVFKPVENIRRRRRRHG